MIGEWTSNFTAEEVMDKVQAVGVEAGVVKNASDMYDDPHLKSYLWAEMEHPEVGKYHLELQPYKLSKVPVQLRRTSPLLGQHNDYVYTNLLGLSEEEYKQLGEEGVFD